MEPYSKKIARVILLGAMASAFLIQPLSPVRNAHAQGGANVTLDARIGFDGHCKDGYWLPVHVEVENTGADLTATVRVSYKNSNNGETSTSMEIELPSVSRKEFFLYIFPQGYLRDFNVSLLDGTRVLEKVNLTANCVTAENMIFGVISDNPGAFDVLGDVKPLTGFARVAHLGISDLPDNAQTWSALDALVISNTDTSTLTAEQKGALETWIASGGKLLVTGGVRWQGTVAGLADFLPIEVNRTQTVFDLSALQAYVGNQSPLESGAVLSVGSRRGDADVLVEQDRIPVLIQKQFGFGTVYFLAADPALQPLSAWDGMAELYIRLLAYRAPTPRWFGNAGWYSYTANQALGAIPVLGLPSIFYITCLLGIYVLIIGPLNYFILRRMKRRELAWVTIPALVIFFSGLSYGTGFLYRGTTPILNRLVVAQAWDGVDQARVRALVGVFSPARARYDLEAALNFLPSPFAGENGDAQSNNNWMLTQDGAITILPDVRVEIGGMKAVTLDGTIPALPISHNLVLEIGKTSPLLTGNILNQSEYTLRDALIVTPGRWERLGDFAPGRSKDVIVSLAASSTGPDFYSQDAMTILGLDYQDFQTDVDEARRYAFFQTILGYEYERPAGNWGVFLMGWVDKSVLPVGLRGKRSDSFDTMLYIQSLSPSLNTQADEWRIPVSLMAWESNNPTVSPYYAPNIPTGGYELRFKPALPIHFQEVQSLNLYLDSNAQPGTLIVSAWDFENQAWVPVASSGRIVAIANPERYVGPGGEVRIKVVSTQSDWTEVRGSYITLVVEP